MAESRKKVSKKTEEVTEFGATETVSLEDEAGKKASVARLISVIAIFAAIVFVIALMAFNTPATKSSDEIWDGATIQGNPEAKNHFVMYTDIMCPYCDYFSRAIMAAQDEFEKYIAENDIVFELRVTDFLYEYNGTTPSSTHSAEATYCAKKEGKFWDYYHAALKALDEDYHSKGFNNSKTAPFKEVPESYWLEVGHKIGLGEEFDNCYKNHETLKELQDNTKQTAKDLQKYGQGGMPFFHFNNFTSSGFDPSWDWSYVKQYFEAGLKS